LLRTENLVRQFKRRVVVRGVSIELREGEIVGLLGPNGAGKTTTFRMTVGLLRPNEGRIWFAGQDVTRLPMYRRARAGMAYLPQESSVFRKLTVRQNLLAVLEYMPLKKRERLARAEELLKEMGLTHVADSPAYTLSGGERRRTEICRALVRQPRVFLLDEPFAGIDPIAVADLQGIVAGLRNRGIGVLITDHNVRETLEITDRAYIIGDGQIVVSGTPREIAQNPIARRTYLGEKFRMDFGEAALPLFEALFVVRPDRSDDDVQALVENIEGTVARGGGTVVRTELWGKRPLTFKDKRFREGYHAGVRFQGQKPLAENVAQMLRADTTVIRTVVGPYEEG
jgi:lipopolysaccharide export system ATP-binding protein